MLVLLFLAVLVALCNWHELDNMQPLAAVAPKDAAPPAPPSQPAAPAPAPKPPPAPVQAAPVKPVVAPPAKPAPVKPAPVNKPAKSTEPIVVRASPGGTKTTTRPRQKEGQEPCDITLKVRTDEAGQGHHVPSKRAFEGAPNYNAGKALAMPKGELERLGLNHQKITGIQRTEYSIFEKTRAPLTWEAITKIETDVLVKGRMDPKLAQATVAKAVQALKDSGVVSPMRIPWGK